jgi:hypothetical protein
MSNKKDKEEEKADVPVRIYVTPTEAEQIEEYRSNMRINNRIPTRTQVVRDLIFRGLEYENLLRQQKSLKDEQE